MRNLLLKNLALSFSLSVWLGNGMNEQQKTQELLEQTLDNLCKHTGRDIYVILPEKVEERNPYLINEIKKTLDKIKWHLKLRVNQNLK